MYDLHFYISTNKKCLMDIAQNMRGLSGEDVYFENNGLVFPKAIGEGRFEFYELDEGLSFMLIDLKEYKNIFNFKREAVWSNDYYILMINLEVLPSKIKGKNEQIVEVGASLKDAVFFGSSGNPVYLMPSDAGKKRSLVLIFTRALIYKYFQRYAIPITVQQLEDLMNDKPVNFVAEMDIESLRVVENIFEAKMPTGTLPLYYTGNVLCLLSLFLNNLIRQNSSEENYKFDDVGRVTDLMDKIMHDVGEAPLLERAAEQCMMSKTKFTKLFKTIYKLNYGDYILEKKLVKAAELLKTGMPVGDVGYRIGYSNMGHFAAAFKKYYNTTPKQYQLQKAAMNEAQ